MGNNLCTCDITSASLCDINSLTKREHYDLSKLPITLNSKMKEFSKADVADSDTKPSIRYIESYTSFNIFFSLIRSITLIQRAYRGHLHAKSLLNPNHSHKATKKANISFIPQTSDTNLKVSIETESISPISDIKPVNEKKELSMRKSISSDYSINSQHKTNSIVIKNKIKGSFVRKNMRYKHKGGLRNGRKDGFGIVTWEDGSVFKAKFNDNSASGVSRYIDATKTRFAGVYEANRPKGYGVYEEEGVLYEGEWNSNDLNGVGVEVWKEESTFYRGEFVNSIKEGIGFYRWEDGTIYQGEWKENKMNGHGMIVYPDERVYFGEVKNDSIEGFGEFNWPDGKKYMGEYVNEKKEGFGVFIWSSEPLIVYAGFWLNGKQHGLGASINNDKATYCLWKNGKKEISFQDQFEVDKHMKKTPLIRWGMLKLNQKELIKKIRALLSTS